VRPRTFFDSVAFRISISIAVVIAASMIAVGWLILREQEVTLESELKNRGRNLAELMAHHIVEPFLYEERHDMFSLLKGSMIGKENVIIYAEVYDKNGEAIVAAYKDSSYEKMELPAYDFQNPIGGIYIEEDKSLPVYHISSPINVETYGTIGFIRMSITKELLYNKLENVKQKLYLLATVVTFLGIILGLYMAKKVLQPILILNKGVKRVGEGEVGVEVPVVGHGEIRELSLSFNRMSVKLKELIDKMKSAQEHLVKTEKLYAIGEFSAGIAHEIKNPLTPIMMLMRRVKEEGESLTVKDIDVIEEEMHRIDNIVKEFLAFTRPHNYEKRRVNINNVLSEVITITRPKIKHSAIRLVEKYLPFLSEITGSHDALKQVFLNIMLNAIQAMDGKGGILAVETSTENGNVRVLIRDSGVGIPEEDLKKIFDPFYTTKKEGTGMGLALTYSIIADHSGKIDIDSTPGSGTTVKVTLPIKEIEGFEG
jgi:signal transduction histidine kinase